MLESDPEVADLQGKKIERQGDRAYLGARRRRAPNAPFCRFTDFFGTVDRPLSDPNQLFLVLN